MPALALHMQQQVLNAVAAALTGHTAAGAGVDIDRVDPIVPAQLPRICISEGENGESSERLTIHGGVDARTLEVTVDCAGLPGGSAADARALGLVVEKTIAADSGLRTLCKMRRIVSSQAITLGEGKEIFAARRQIWNFVYYVNPASPDAPL